MNDLEYNFKEIDGAIFLSNSSKKCLKRWFKDSIQMIEPTVVFFQFCKELVQKLKLESELIIPQIYEKGIDFVAMDYDASAIALSEKSITKSNEKTLNILLNECKNIKSKNSYYLKLMIENKSVFIRESFETKKIIIGGLEIY